MDKYEFIKIAKNFAEIFDLIIKKFTQSKTYIPYSIKYNWKIRNEVNKIN